MFSLYLIVFFQDIRGPQDRYEAQFPVFAKLSVPFVARYVRIIPNSFGSMRAELYGCSVEELPPYNGRHTVFGARLFKPFNHQ